MRIWYVDVASKKFTQVDKERYWAAFSDDWVPVWSPDSKSLAYSKRLGNYMGAIHVYSLGDRKITQITDGLAADLKVEALLTSVCEHLAKSGEPQKKKAIGEAFGLKEGDRTFDRALKAGVESGRLVREKQGIYALGTGENG